MEIFCFLHSNKTLYHVARTYLMLIERYKHFLENMLRYEVNNLVHSPHSLEMVYKEEATVLYFHLTSNSSASKSQCIVLILIHLGSSLLV